MTPGLPPPAALPRGPAPEPTVTPGAPAPAPESLVRPAVTAPAPERFPLTTTTGAPPPLAAAPAVERQELPAIVPPKRPAVAPAPSTEGGQPITIPGRLLGVWQFKLRKLLPKYACY